MAVEVYDVPPGKSRAEHAMDKQDTPKDTPTHRQPSFVFESIGGPHRAFEAEQMKRARRVCPGQTLEVLGILCNIRKADDDWRPIFLTRLERFFRPYEGAKDYDETETGHRANLDSLARSRQRADIDVPAVG